MFLFCLISWTSTSSSSICVCCMVSIDVRLHLFFFDMFGYRNVFLVFLVSTSSFSICLLCWCGGCLSTYILCRTSQEMLLL